jgi:inner membrane protein
VDPLSQGALGAAAAGLIARPGSHKPALVLGALAGMAPDLDALVRSSSDPLLFLEVHRQFSHAFVFIPFGALVCALIAHPVARRSCSFAHSYAFCLLGYGSHGLLDACTSYGTQLFWPFSDARVAWNVIAVVDPLFTLPLLLVLGLAFRRFRPRLARLAVAWAFVYLSVGLLQRERAHDVARALAEGRGHAPTTIAAKPSFGNLLLWKTFYEYEQRYWVDAVRMAPQPRIYPGQDTAKLDLGRDLPWLTPGSRQAIDLERFRWFSDGYVALDPRDPNRVIDVRYSLVPDRIEALWGIELDRDRPPQAHAVFFSENSPSPEHRTALQQMLQGAPAAR